MLRWSATIIWIANAALMVLSAARGLIALYLSSPDTPLIIEVEPIQAKGWGRFVPLLNRQYLDFIVFFATLGIALAGKRVLIGTSQPPGRAARFGALAALIAASVVSYRFNILPGVNAAIGVITALVFVTMSVTARILVYHHASAGIETNSTSRRVVLISVLAIVGSGILVIVVLHATGWRRQEALWFLVIGFLAAFVAASVFLSDPEKIPALVEERLLFLATGVFILGRLCKSFRMYALQEAATLGVDLREPRWLWDSPCLGAVWVALGIGLVLTLTAIQARNLKVRLSGDALNRP